MMPRAEMNIVNLSILVLSAAMFLFFLVQAYKLLRSAKPTRKKPGSTGGTLAQWILATQLRA
jgi:hypothetical protein